MGHNRHPIRGFAAWRILPLHKPKPKLYSKVNIKISMQLQGKECTSNHGTLWQLVIVLKGEKSQWLRVGYFWLTTLEASCGKLVYSKLGKFRIKKGKIRESIINVQNLHKYKNIGQPLKKLYIHLIFTFIYKLQPLSEIFNSLQIYFYHYYWCY